VGVPRGRSAPAAQEAPTYVGTFAFAPPAPVPGSPPPHGSVCGAKPRRRIAQRQPFPMHSTAPTAAPAARSNGVRLYRFATIPISRASLLNLLPSEASRT
jgi:hypothetical protein